LCRSATQRDSSLVIRGFQCRSRSSLMLRADRGAVPSGASRSAENRQNRRAHRSFEWTLKWHDVLSFARGGTPRPDRKVVKTQAECRQQSNDEAYKVTAKQTPSGHSVRLFASCSSRELNSACAATPFCVPTSPAKSTTSYEARQAPAQLHVYAGKFLNRPHVRGHYPHGR
jgi:hypothetical protein